MTERTAQPGRGTPLQRVMAGSAPYLALAGVWGLFAAIMALGEGPNPLLTWTDLRGAVILRAALLAPAVLGMTLLLIAGRVDLSLAGAALLAMVVCGGPLGLGAPSHGPLVGLLLALGVGAACGLLNGVLVGLLAAPAALVTLATLLLYTALATQLMPQNLFTTEAGWLGSFVAEPDAVAPPLVWVALGAAVVLTLGLRLTRAGRWLYAMGSNRATARLCGVPVGGLTIVTHAAAGLLAGATGAMLAAAGAALPVMSNDPTSLGSALWLSLSLLAAALIGGSTLCGGRGSAAGSLAGLLVIVVLSASALSLDMGEQGPWAAVAVTLLAVIGADRLRRWMQS